MDTERKLLRYVVLYTPHFLPFPLKSFPYSFCSGLLYSHSLCHRPEEHQGRVPRGSDLRGDAQLPSLRKQDRTRPRLDAGARLFQSSSANSYYPETQATSTRGAGTSYTSDDEDERNRLGGEGGAAGGPPVGPPGARSHSSGLARLRSNKNS